MYFVELGTDVTGFDARICSLDRGSKQLSILWEGDALLRGLFVAPNHDVHFIRTCPTAGRARRASLKSIKTLTFMQQLSANPVADREAATGSEAKGISLDGSLTSTPVTSFKLSERGAEACMIPGEEIHKA